MEKSDNQEDANEVTLFDIKDDLGNLFAKSLRKLSALLIDSVDERSMKT